jgi:large subunit ribosomal protein L32e
MLASLDPEVHAVRIAAGVGMRKRKEIQRRATEAGLRVLNLREFPETEEEPAGETGEAEEVSEDE